jgi:hypothetical protein
MAGIAKPAEGSSAHATPNTVGPIGTLDPVHDTFPGVPECMALKVKLSQYFSIWPKLCEQLAVPPCQSGDLRVTMVFTEPPVFGSFLPEFPGDMTMR